MKGIQVKLNKLVLALTSKGRIIKINQEQYYSKKFEKVFTNFIVSETCKEEMKIKSLIKEIRENIKVTKDKNYKKELKKEKERLEITLGKISVPKYEFRKKLDMLLHLVKRYEEVTAHERN